MQSRNTAELRDVFSSLLRVFDMAAACAGILFFCARQKRLRSEFPGWEPAAAVFAHAENKTMCPRQKHVKVTKNRHAISQYYGIAFRENKI